MDGSFVSNIRCDLGVQSIGCEIGAGFAPTLLIARLKMSAAIPSRASRKSAPYRRGRGRQAVDKIGGRIGGRIGGALALRIEKTIIL